MSKFTVWSLGTKTRQIVGAGQPENMLESTVGTMFAKASVEPGAWLHLVLLSNVQENTFWITALLVLCKKPAFWHFFGNVLVQEFTCITLFTQCTQPMLTNNGLLCSDVSEWAVFALGTVTSQIKFANFTRSFL